MTFSYMHKIHGYFDSSHYQSIIKSQATTTCTCKHVWWLSCIHTTWKGSRSLVTSTTQHLVSQPYKKWPYSILFQSLPPTGYCYTHTQATNTQLQYQNVSSLAVDCSSCCSCCSAGEQPIHGMASGGVAMTCTTRARPWLWQTKTSWG